MNSPNGIAEESISQSTHTTQADIELRPVENSDRPILANFAAVQTLSGLVCLDFGFLDPQALNSITRLANSGETGRASVRGQLACRVALSSDTVASLARQLNQLLQSQSHEHANQQVRPEGGAKEANLH
jgi:hypothetical protein